MTERQAARLDAAAGRIRDTGSAVVGTPGFIDEVSRLANGRATGAVCGQSCLSKG
jgi:hypothetical protein